MLEEIVGALVDGAGFHPDAVAAVVPVVIPGKRVQGEILHAGSGHAGIVDGNRQALVERPEAPVAVPGIVPVFRDGIGPGIVVVIQVILRMEPPGFVEGEEQIARCIGAPVQGDVHHDVVQVGPEVDFLDDGRGQRLDPVARVQRIVRIDTHAVVVADGGVFRVEDILRHRDMSICLPVGGDGSLIYAACVVFGPDALDGNLGPGVVRAGP